MHYISDSLYWISTGLMVPVVCLLIVLFLRALWLVLGFFGQYLQVQKKGAILRKHFQHLDAEHLDELEQVLPQTSGLLVTPFLMDMLQQRCQVPQLHLLAAGFELLADRQLATCKTLAKLGPMLGLMGTLIPMGPALTGLSQGDISSMAYNMQVAFATTVVGLFCSAVGFFIGQVKERWLFQEQAYLQCLLDLLIPSETQQSHA